MTMRGFSGLGKLWTTEIMTLLVALLLSRGVNGALISINQEECYWKMKIAGWPLALELKQCSNHGVCANSTEFRGSVCECDRWWTGRSDFINSDGVDCQINELAIKILWGVQLFLVLLMTTLSVPHVWLRWNTHQRAKEAAKEVAKEGGSLNNVSIWKNRALLAVLSYHFVCVPAMICMAVLRLVDSSQRIGISLAATVLFGIARFGFYTQLAFVQPALLEVFLSTSKKSHFTVQRIIAISYWFAGLNWVLSTVCGFIPLSTVILSNNERATSGRAMTAFIIYIGFTMLSLVMYAAQAAYILKKSSKLLGRSFKVTLNERVLKLKERLADLQIEIIRQSLLHAAIYGIFLLWPYMYNKHDYWVPIGWCAYPLIGRKLAFTAIENSSPKTGVKRIAHSILDGLGDSPTVKSQGSEDLLTIPEIMRHSVSQEFSEFEHQQSFKIQQSPMFPLEVKLGFSEAVDKKKFATRTNLSSTRDNKGDALRTTLNCGHKSANDKKKKVKQQQLMAAPCDFTDLEFMEKVISFLQGTAQSDLSNSDLDGIA